MIQDNVVFITFKPNGNKFSASLALEDFEKLNENIQNKLEKAEIIYEKYITLMKSILLHRQQLKSLKKLIPARLIWELGNNIFDLKIKLELLDFEVNNLYAHLERDTSLKRKYLEKVVILRRYINTKKMIPSKFNWSYFEHGTGSKAKVLGRKN